MIGSDVLVNLIRCDDSVSCLTLAFELVLKIMRAAEVTALVIRSMLWEITVESSQSMRNEYGP